MDDDEVLDGAGELLLEGRVIDLDRLPVAGARVWLGRKQSTITSSDGRFAFPGLAPGLYGIQSRKRDLGCEVELVTLRANRAVELVVVPGATLHLRLTDGNAPVANATVEMDGEVAATSDEHGLAIVRGLGHRFQMVEVSARGYAPAFVSMTLAFDSGGTIERAVTLRPGIALSGVVVRPDGSKIPDATIRLWGEWGGEVTSDAQGLWQFESVAPGEYQLTAYSNHQAISKTEVLSLEASRADVVIETFVGGRLCGIVTGINEAPIAGASVDVIRGGEDHPAVATYRCDASGRFDVRVEPGRFDVFAHHDGVLASALQHVDVCDDGMIEVSFVVRPSSIAGVVVDENGKPVAGAEVRVRADFLRADLTDELGRFALGAFPPGEYAVSVSETRNYDFAPGVTVNAAAGATDIQIVLSSPGAITGHVVFGGSSLSHFAVLVTRCPQFPFIGQPINVRSTDGCFRFDGVRPGPWGLVFAGPGTRLHTLANVEVVSGQTIDVGTVELTRGQRITGSVRDANGAPVAGARVTIGNRDLDESLHLDPSQRWFHSNFEVMSKDDGRFVFEGVTSLRSPNARPSPMTATHAVSGSSVAVPVPEGDANVDLVLVACGSIEGRIADYAGQFASVSAHRKGVPADLRTARMSKAGAFQIDDVTPGEYRIEVMMLPGQTAPKPVVVIVVAGQVTTVHLGGG